MGMRLSQLHSRFTTILLEPSLRNQISFGFSICLSFAKLFFTCKFKKHTVPEDQQVSRDDLEQNHQEWVNIPVNKHPPWVVKQNKQSHRDASKTNQTPCKRHTDFKRPHLAAMIVDTPKKWRDFLSCANSYPAYSCIYDCDGGPKSH